MRKFEETRELSDVIWLLISIDSTEDWIDPEDEFYFCVRKIDIKKITLPEWQDLNQNQIPTEEEKKILLLRSGWGLTVAAGGVHTIGEAKKKIESLVRDVDLEIVKPNLFLHHRKWEKLREEDPSAFSAGFYLGSRRQNLADTQVSKPLVAGWRQGWEFAVGKMGLPEWIKTKKKTA